MPPSCDACSIAHFSSDVAFQRHMKDFHDVNVDLPSSPKATGNGSSMFTTMEPSKGQQELTVCEPCGKVFQNTNNLVQHLRSKDHLATVGSTTEPTANAPVGGGGQVISCPPCQRTFPTQHSLDQHQLGKLHRRQLEEFGLEVPLMAPTLTFCKICSRECGNAKNLQTHMLGMVHWKKASMQSNADELPKFACKPCDREFDSKHNLDQHLASKRHANKTRHLPPTATTPVGRSRFYCETCKVDCRSEVNLQVHVAGRRHRSTTVTQTSTAAPVPRKARMVQPSDDDDWVDVQGEDGTDEKQLFECVECQVKTYVEKDYDAHMRGKRHLERSATELPHPPPCMRCNATFADIRERARHMNSEAHKAELARVVSSANSAFRNLETLNGWLLKLGVESQPSLNTATKALRGIYINIFDLVNENFSAVHSSYREFLKHIRQSRLYFPKEEAKASELKYFLRRVF